MSEEIRFIRDAQTQEYLSADEEIRLAREFRENGCEKSLEQLIRSHIRLVIKAVRKLNRLQFDNSDLIQEGIIGMMRAAQNFDPDQGTRFSTYASFWVKAQINEFMLRNFSIIRTPSTTDSKKLFFNIRRLMAQHFVDHPHDTQRQAHEAVAKLTGIEVDVVEGMANRLAAPSVSLDAPIRVDREEMGSLGSLLPCQAALPDEAVSAALDGERLRGALYGALATLSDREKEIVINRHYTDNPLTLESLSIRYGISKERVRQVESKALGKLREFLSDQPMFEAV